MKKRRKLERPGATRGGSIEATATAPSEIVPAADATGRRAKYLAILFLAALVLIPYGQVLSFDFVTYDDDLYVTDNPRLEAGLTLDNLVWAFTTEEGGNWHPLTWLSYMLDVDLFGVTNAGAFHAINLLFHLVNSILLFLLLQRMTRQLWPSFLVAALFAVHPLHVESVAWIAERKDVLSTFFWLLTMLAYSHYAASPGRRGPGNPSHLPVGGTLLVVVLFILGLMAKPMLVTLPAVLLLMDYWPLQRPLNKGLLLEKLPLFAVVVVFSVVTVLTQKGSNNVITLSELPLWLRGANAVVAYGKYAVMMVAPVGLTMFYPHPGFHLPVWQVLVSGAFLVAVSAAVVRWRKNRPYLLVGWLWYLGTLVPVIGFIQTGAQAFADRYTYVPLIGLFIMAVWGIQDLKWAGFSKTDPHSSPSREASSSRFAGCPNRLKTRPTLLAVGACSVLAALTAATAIQVSYWRDSVRLFEHTLRVNPSNYLGHNNLGIVLLRQKRLDEAKAHFAKAVEAKSNYIEAHSNLGEVLMRQGKYDEAKPQFLKALELKPDYDPALSNLGAVLLCQGHVEEAKVQVLKALELKPDFADAHNSLGVALLREGHLDEAQAEFTKAVKFKPDFADAYSNLGLVLVQQGHAKEGETDLTKALELDPDCTEALKTLSGVLLAQGRAEEAKTCLMKAVKLKPDYTDALYSLGVLLAQQGHPQEAETHLTKVLQLQPESVEALKTLGGVLLAQGRDEEAKTCLKKALKLKPDYADALNNLGIAFAHEGHPDEAKTYFTKALELKPDFIDAGNNLGALVLSQGNAAEAVDYFSRVLAKRPDSDAYANLGAALAANHEYEKARQNLEQALKLDPNCQRAREALSALPGK